MQYAIIYLLTNTINQKQYVGFANDYDARMATYRRETDEHRHLTDSIRHYGWAVFTSEIIYMSKDAYHCKNEAEVALIADYNTYKGRGYNYTIGGDGASGYKHTEEWKKLMSEKRSGCGHHMYGKKHKQSSNEKNRNSQLGEKSHNFGKKFTAETKKLMSESMMGKNKGEKSPLYGIHKSEEHKSKIAMGNTKLTVPEKEHLLFWLNFYNIQMDVACHFGVSNRTISRWKIIHGLLVPKSQQ